MERLLGGARVILCTLSMLPNKRLENFISIVPVQCLIVDEASQIELGDYLAPTHLLCQTLRRIVLVGDEKQRMYIRQMPRFVLLICI